MFYENISREDFARVSDTFVTYETDNTIYTFPAILNKTEEILLKFGVVLESTDSVAELFVLDSEDILKNNAKVICDGAYWRIIKILNNIDGVKHCLVTKLEQSVFSKQLKKER